ncbi:MAG TPA: hypothetical protein VLH40_03935 [Atribacteraceae bacterium]|nr:hypothetical protein [Atribacteraceae bacterium]
MLRFVLVVWLVLGIALSFSVLRVFGQVPPEETPSTGEVLLPEAAVPPVPGSMTLEIPDGRPAIELTGERLIYHPDLDEITVINGQLAYRDFTLQADIIRIDLERNELEAEGNVVVREGREGSLSRTVRYDWGREVWYFQDMASHITGRGIEGIIFFRGESVVRTEEKSEITRAFLTTCDLAEPHYHIEARRIEIYPGKRVILHNLSFHDFNTRLISIPHYVIFLDRREQLPFLPMVGHTSADGFYVNFFYNYFVSPESFGTVYLDWWEKRGWGLGIRHFLEGDAANERGQAYFYYTDRRQGEDTLIGHVQYQRQLAEDTVFAANLDYRGVPGEVQDHYTGRLSITQDRDRGTTRWDLSFDSDLVARRDSLLSRLLYTYDFGDQLIGSILLDYTRLSAWEASRDDRLRYLLSLSKVEGDYTYILRYESYGDMGSYGIDPAGRRFVYRMPEFEIMKRQTRLGQSDFLYRTGLIYGHYWEEETGVIEDRLRLWLDMEGRSTLGPWTTLVSNFRFEQDFYGNDFARYIWAGGLRLDHRLAPGLDVSLNYHRRDFDGATPFRFDFTTRRTDALGVTLNYRSGPWRIGMDTGYDFLAEDYLEGSVFMGYDFDEKNSLLLRGSYDFDNGEWTGLTLGFGASIAVTPEWRLEFDGNWNLLAGRVSGIQVGITRDLHCREISLVYDNDRETFWLEYSIKAFPTEKFILGGG